MLPQSFLGLCSSVGQSEGLLIPRSSVRARSQAMTYNIFKFAPPPKPVPSFLFPFQFSLLLLLPSLVITNPGHHVDIMLTFILTPGGHLTFQDKLTPNTGCRVSISVSMPACHAGELGSIPRRGGSQDPPHPNSDGLLFFFKFIP